jgi:hypothetical protein
MRVRRLLRPLVVVSAAALLLYGFLPAGLTQPTPLPQAPQLVPTTAIRDVPRPTPPLPPPPPVKVSEGGTCPGKAWSASDSWLTRLRPLPPTRRRRRSSSRLGGALSSLSLWCSRCCLGLPQRRCRAAIARPAALCTAAAPTVAPAGHATAAMASTATGSAAPSAPRGVLHPAGTMARTSLTQATVVSAHAAYTAGGMVCAGVTAATAPTTTSQARWTAAPVAARAPLASPGRRPRRRRPRHRSRRPFRGRRG